MGIKLKVRGPRGQERIIDLCDTEEQLRSITVLQLREKIREELKIAIGPDFYLLYKAECLEEESALLSHYGIGHMSEILVVFVCPGGGGVIGGMGDKDGKNRSMETLDLFNAPE